MSADLSRRLPILALLACGWVAALCGCANRAHTDLYQQRLASEARVLEDQLYDADYQNRILRDKLERYQRELEATKIPTPSVAPKTPDSAPSKRAVKRRESSSEPDPTPDPLTDNSKRDDSDSDRSDSRDMGSGNMEHGFDSDELELPMFDVGEPVDPEALTDPLPLDNQRLPAPGGPVPPGKQDTEVPPVDPGEILPPPLNDDEVKPPGQIILPDSIQASGGVPAELRLHPTLSSGHQSDGNVDGALLIVTAVDAAGHPVDLAAFDVDADMSIVVLDPSREAGEAKIGRWDFKNREVATLVRTEPISGLHVPIRWQAETPDGDEVIVHVRLRGEATEMRCQGRIKLSAKTAVSEWTPRGEKLR